MTEPATAHPPPKNALHIVIGQPATGKTSFGALLAKHLRAALVDIDHSSEPIVRAALTALDMDPDDRDSPRYKSIFRDAIYQTLFEIARINLTHVDVVLTGPFTSEFASPTWLQQLKTQLPAAGRIEAYHLHCDPDRIKSRLEHRANPRDAQKLANWEQYQAYYADQAKPAFPHHSIDTSATDLAQLETLARAFAARPQER